MASTVRLMQFPPDSIIELDDPMTGDRHLGLVADSGTEFFHYEDRENMPTPLAILESLNPQLAQTGQWAEALMFKGDIEKWHGFEDLVDALYDTPLVGKLSRHRAAYAAYVSGNYDVAAAVAAGQQADALARARMATISARADELIEAGVI